jgi:hypothetical protein
MCPIAAKTCVTIERLIHATMDFHGAGTFQGAYEEFAADD